MRDIIIIIATYLFFLLIDFGAYLFSFRVRIPLTHIDLAIVGIICLLIAARLRFRQAAEVQSRQMHDFQLFFLYFAVFTLILALPALFFNNLYRYQQWVAITYWMGHFFLFISLAYFIRIPFFWINPLLMNYGSLFFVLMGSITTMVLILHPVSANISSSGTSYWHVSVLAATLIAGNGTLALLPTAIYFIYKAIVGIDRAIKNPLLMMGIGIIILLLGGPLHNIVSTPLLFFLADIMTSLGIVILAIGVFYRRSFGE